MKICDVTQFYSPVSGGVKRYLREKQRYLGERPEHEHILIVPGAEDATEVSHGGRCRVHTIRSPQIDPTSRYRLLWRVGAVRRLLDQEQPDVIECADPYHVAWVVLSWGQQARVPVAGFYHSHFPDAYLRTLDRFVGRTARDFVQDLARDYIGRLYSRFEATFVPSPHLAELLRAWGVASAESVRLGVDGGVFTPGERDEAMRAEVGAHAGEVLLLTVGRLAGEKNVQVLLDAFRLLHARHPRRWRLLVVGDGPLRWEVERAAEETGAVSWRPYFEDSHELARVYRAADVMVHPGVHETFGLVTVEAQACGLPVVAFRGTFMDRLAFAGIEYWAPERSAASLAEAVEAIAHAPLREMGMHASEIAHRDYSWPVVLDALMRRYASIVDGARPGVLG